MQASRVVIAALLDQLGAQRANGSVLVRVVSLRDHDRAGDVEKTGSIGERLAMIAGGARDYAASLDVVGQPGHEVNTAANLEGRRGRMVFEFQVVPAAQHLGKSGPFVKGRGADVPVHGR